MISHCYDHPFLRNLCKHIIACVSAVQGGLPNSEITLGKTAAAETIVDGTNTAKAVGSGSLDVFATPMMLALMEKAACAVLEDTLEEGQTSVGISITAEHNAASPLGMNVSATAIISSVRGRRITFEVSASDKVGEIGRGVHIRVIVDKERFVRKANNRTKN
jgi:predicted thioesterase